MKHKALALILCLTVVLTVALPGTLAVSMDAQTTTTTLTVDAVDKTPDVQPTETTAPQPPTDPTAPQKTEEETENETTETTAPSNQEESTGDDGTTETTVPEGKTGSHNLPTCTDQCAAEDCACVCHLVAKLLVTENVDAFFALADAVTQEQYAAMTQEQLAQIDAHLAAIEPKPAPAIILDNNDAPVASEICTPTKNFTNVAPLGDPVIGK